MEVTVMDFGRLDLIPSRKGIAGVVIGAPHGTYDEYTAEIVEQLGYRTGLATVIARGFSHAGRRLAHKCQSPTKKATQRQTSK